MTCLSRGRPARTRNRAQTFHPDLLDKIRAESHDEAIRVVRWAWKAEQQHRDKMQQILRWSPAI